MMEKIIGIFAPHDCLSCGVEGKLLCDWCKMEAVAPVPSRCYRCKKQSRDFQTCQSCRRESKLGHVWITSDYKDLSKVLIGKLKFERAQAAADLVADLMVEVMPYLPRDTVVTFVPTATSRRRQRGYDQSELITMHLAMLLGLKSQPLLLRSGQSRQVGATRETRKKQLAQAFRPRRPSQITGLNILLVDDITTTGATLEAAALALRQAGAKTINATAFAQK